MFRINNKYNGQGIFYFLQDNQFKGDKYVGFFKNGKYHGQGTYYYEANNSSKGDVFSGMYKYNKININLFFLNINELNKY